MTEQEFNFNYDKRKDLSNQYDDLRPIIDYILELAGSITYGEEDVLLYVDKIQKDLLDNKVIPFMISNVEDIDKLERVHGDTKRALWYIWLAHQKEAERLGTY